MASYHDDSLRQRHRPNRHVWSSVYHQLRSRPTGLLTLSSRTGPSTHWSPKSHMYPLNAFCILMIPLKPLRIPNPFPPQPPCAAVFHRFRTPPAKYHPSLSDPTFCYINVIVPSLFTTSLVATGIFAANSPASIVPSSSSKANTLAPAALIVA